MAIWRAFGLTARLDLILTSPKHLLTLSLAWDVCPSVDFYQLDLHHDSFVFPNPAPSSGRGLGALAAQTWLGGKDCQVKANWKLPQTVLCQSNLRYLSSSNLLVMWLLGQRVWGVREQHYRGPGVGICEAPGTWTPTWSSLL